MAPSLSTRRMITVIWTVLGLLVILTAGVLVLYLRQHAMIYYPRAYHPAELRASSGLVVLTFVTPDGRQTAFYLPPREGPSIVPHDIWVVFGGNASVALDWYDFVAAARDSGSGILFVEYPGYGQCEGDASPGGILRNSEGALDALGHHLDTVFPRNGSGGGDAPGLPLAPEGDRGAAKSGRRGERDRTAPRIHMLGHSLGAAAVLQCAARRPVDRIILLAPFTTMRAMAETVVGPWLAGLLKHNFDNLARLQELRLRSPTPRITVFHGARDRVIPVEMGRAIAAAAPEMMSYSELPAAGHNDLLSACGHDIRRLMQR